MKPAHNEYLPIKTEQNIAIAEALGFERYTYDHCGEKTVAWRYPSEWRHLMCSNPEHTIPDFVGIITDTVEFSKRNFIRRDQKSNTL